MNIIDRFTRNTDEALDVELLEFADAYRKSVLNELLPKADPKQISEYVSSFDTRLKKTIGQHIKLLKILRVKFYFAARGRNYFLRKTLSYQSPHHKIQFGNLCSLKRTSFLPSITLRLRNRIIRSLGAIDILEMQRNFSHIDDKDDEIFTKFSGENTDMMKLQDCLSAFRTLNAAIRVAMEKGVDFEKFDIGAYEPSALTPENQRTILEEEMIDLIIGLMLKYDCVFPETWKKAFGAKLDEKRNEEACFENDRKTGGLLNYIGHQKWHEESLGLVDRRLWPGAERVLIQKKYIERHDKESKDAPEIKAGMQTVCGLFTNPADLIEELLHLKLLDELVDADKK